MTIVFKWQDSMILESLIPIFLGSNSLPLLEVVALLSLHLLALLVGVGV